MTDKPITEKPIFEKLKDGFLDRLKPQTVRKAMTWRILDQASRGDRRYLLVGSDALTNPYSGDTFLSDALPILCIAKDNLPKPDLTRPSETPGGALRGSWSGGRVFFTAPVRGSRLQSRAIADQRCNQEANAVKGPWNGRYRMAAFHDGDKAAGWAGWDFWADATDFAAGPSGKAKLESLMGQRFWVAIDDQPANPWNR